MPRARNINSCVRARAREYTRRYYIHVRTHTRARALRLSKLVNHTKCSARRQACTREAEQRVPVFFTAAHLYDIAFNKIDRRHHRHRHRCHHCCCCCCCYTLLLLLRLATRNSSNAFIMEIYRLFRPKHVNCISLYLCCCCHVK